MIPDKKAVTNAGYETVRIDLIRVMVLFLLQKTGCDFSFHVILPSVWNQASRPDTEILYAIIRK